MHVGSPVRRCCCLLCERVARPKKPMNMLPRVADERANHWENVLDVAHFVDEATDKMSESNAPKSWTKGCQLARDDIMSIQMNLFQRTKGVLQHDERHTKCTANSQTCGRGRNMRPMQKHSAHAETRDPCRNARPTKKYATHAEIHGHFRENKLYKPTTQQRSRPQGAGVWRNNQRRWWRVMMMMGVDEAGGIA